MCGGAREGKEQEEVIYRKERDDSKKRNSKIRQGEIRSVQDKISQRKTQEKFSHALFFSQSLYGKQK